MILRLEVDVTGGGREEEVVALGHLVVMEVVCGGLNPLFTGLWRGATVDASMSQGDERGRDRGIVGKRGR